MSELKPGISTWDGVPAYWIETSLDLVAVYIPGINCVVPALIETPGEYWHKLMVSATPDNPR